MYLVELNYQALMMDKTLQEQSSCRERLLKKRFPRNFEAAIAPASGKSFCFDACALKTLCMT
jgi:hypothetical protein